jgi:hypothetical protein
MAQLSDDGEDLGADSCRVNITARVVRKARLRHHLIRQRTQRGG